MSTTEKKKTLEFKLDAVNEKPNRAYRKGSKYDAILTAFEKSNKPLVKVEMPDTDANYIRTQINKRIQATKAKMKVSVTNGVCYLEKEVTVSIKAPSK